MALPKSSDLKLMDYSYQGQPFVNVPAKTGMDLSSMDYSFQAQPFVPNPDTSSVSHQSDSVSVSEYIQISVFLYLSTFDSVVITEEIAKTSISNPGVSDTITVVDVVSLHSLVEYRIFDPISVSEDIVLLIPVLFINESDLITVTTSIFDITWFISVSDNVYIVENYSAIKRLHGYSIGRPQGDTVMYMGLGSL